MCRWTLGTVEDRLIVVVGYFYRPEFRIRKPDVRDVSGMLVERVFLVSGVVKTVFSPNKKNKRSFSFFLVAGEHNYKESEIASLR